MRLFLSISNDTFFVYYLLSNVIYLILLITAISRTRSTVTASPV